MSIDDKLREAAQAVEGLWTDSADTSERLSRLQHRIRRDAAPAPRNSRGGERPLSEIDLLTVAETAALMGVTKMTVYKLVHSKVLPAIRVGRSFRVPEVSVLAYLEENDMADILG